MALYTVEEALAHPKIHADLRAEITRAAGLPELPVVVLDREDRLSADLRVWTVDGASFLIEDKNMPPTWTVREWVDFIVRLAESPYIKTVSVVKEWPFLEWLFLAPWDIPPSLSVEEATARFALKPKPEPKTSPAAGPAGIPLSPTLAAALGAALLLLALVLSRR